MSEVNKTFPTPDITAYDNFVLANEIEDQFNSHLGLSRFTTIDKSLVGTAGMKKIIHRYSATNGTEKLARGEGNSKVIGVTYTPVEYVIALAQNRFAYHDEDYMIDPLILDTGIKYAATDMFNTVNADIMAEYKKATLTHSAAVLDFAAFARAKAKLKLPESDAEREKIEVFAFLKPTVGAELAITLGEQLKYVEAFARTGYIGTVAGVNLYEKWDADENEIVVATRKAVTTFIKKGTETETERAANTRLNTLYSRKYYVEALTDDTQVCLIQLTAGGDTSDAGENP